MGKYNKISSDTSTAIRLTHHYFLQSVHFTPVQIRKFKTLIDFLCDFRRDFGGCERPLYVQSGATDIALVR